LVNAFGTAPVWQAYWMVVHTDLRSDIKGLSNFEPTADYPTRQSVLESELGSLDEVRVCKTTQAPKSTAAAPVYSNFLLAANGYGTLTIDEQSMEMIIKGLGEGEDPLNQRSTMGWKGRFAAVLLDDTWVVNLRCTKG